MKYGMPGKKASCEAFLPASKMGRDDLMARKSAIGALTACVICLSSGLAARGQAVAEPPYVILLRSRDAVVTPERTKHGDTGGGFIQVTQILPNVVVFLMRGAVVAGLDHGGNAAMQFKLNQDLEIVATHPGLRPPRLITTAWLIGSLNSSLKNGGTAEQAPACATLRGVGDPIIQMCMKPHSVGGGENLLVNERVGPFEAVAVPGPYCLAQTFALNATQPRYCCCAGSAAAHFDPDPRLDSRWNDVLKPFRAVPKQNFGFRVILRVVEDVPPVEAPPTPPAENLPPPEPVPPTKEPLPPAALNSDNHAP
jgi:hypothetical protein